MKARIVVVGGKECIYNGTSKRRDACAVVGKQVGHAISGEDVVRFLVSTFAIVVSLGQFLTTSWAAETYPSRSIRLLVGFPAGGPSDVPARIIAEKLRTALGQPVVVENKTGAAGMIALNEMLSQARDGYTLLLCSYIDAINTVIYRKPTYKVADIEPITLISKAYYAFAIPAALPPNSLKEFIDYAKARPGTLNYGRVGSGSVTELLAKKFEQIAGVSMTGVTFRGTGPAMQEIVAGRLDFMVGPLAVTMPLYEAKKVKVIGMTSPERLAIAPAVPTLAEQGMPIVNYGWWGLCAGSGIPKPVVELLNRHVGAAVASDDYRATMDKSGVIAISSTPDEFSRLLVETAKEADVMVRELGIEKLD
jgi:tripartite-type tricarboxylate transporter receptor subunit TctC